MNIPASDLKHALKKLSLVKEERIQMKAYSMGARDPDVWVIESHPMQDLEATFTLAGKKLAQVLNRMSGNVEVFQQARSLLLKSAKARVELEITPAKEASLPSSPETFLSFPLEPLKAAISKALTWASTNKSTPFGGVIQLRTTPEKEIGVDSFRYSVIGTDGNSLSVIEVPRPGGMNVNWLINLSAAQTVQLMDGPSVEIGETPTHLHFKCGSTVIYASRPNKNFPDYPKFVPREFDFTIQVKSAEFVSALRTVEPLIDEPTDGGGISIQIRDGVVQLSSLGTGSIAEDSVEYEQIHPDPVFDPKEFQLKMKASYLSSFFSKAGEISTMSFLGPLKPIKLQSGDITTIVMPIGKKEKK